MSEHVLVVDDDSDMCSLLVRGLQTPGYSAQACTSAAEAIRHLEAGHHDLVVTDLRMGGATGLTLCRHVVEHRPDVPVIVITAFGSLEVAVDAMRAGAFDFLTKPFDLDTLRGAVQRATRHRSLTRSFHRLHREPRPSLPVRRMLGSSQEMLRLFDLIERVAPSSAAVLICGESGSGKELVARELHERSRQARGPFVAINCAAMPESLLESELFGYEKGAFTDARSDRPGLFQQADGGTLFLDEIAELPLGLQPKLLRALQERSVRPVGGRREIPFSARLVAATNEDLEAAVAAGRFREDLYYRIQVIQVDVPPLRHRGADILLLAQHFIEHFARQGATPVETMLPAVASRLEAYAWPGNVRELRNCIERAVTLCQDSALTPADLPTKISSVAVNGAPLRQDDRGEMIPMEEVERRHVLRVFEATGKNKSLTAQILSLNRKTLYRKLRQYGALPGETRGD
jgi:two-component system response regulator HydG